MDKVQYSPAFLRKRKMMLALPLLVLPFITLGFWALGGGKGAAAQLPATVATGMNLKLPGARLKNDKGLDKMSYYEMADADSEKLKQRMRSDAYFNIKNITATDAANGSEDNNDDSFPAPQQSRLNGSAYSQHSTASASETKVYEKLKQINTALDNAATRSGVEAAPVESAPPDIKVDRLEKMMQTMKQDRGGNDPEMNQINSMLEKVMDIQHPERLSEKYRQDQNAQRQQPFAVTGKDEKNNGFFSALTDGNTDTIGQTQNAIEATVCETQTLVNGATIKLRLLTDIYINGRLIPANNFVSGKVSLSGERLTVFINAIRYHNALLPVALSAYDTDGIDGIYIPGAITRDVAKQSADNALQSVALGSLDPSIGAQAASAGVETAKAIISRKVKLVRVTVKSGYHLWLKDNNKR